MEINIVISNDFKEIIEKHSKWELDLGRSYSRLGKSGVMQVNIQDKFVLDFFREANVLCYKIGRMGSINFYSSFALPDNQVWVYNGKKKITLPYQRLDLLSDTEEYISTLVMSTMEDEE